MFLSRQVSYAIGVAEPISITVFDYGTSDKSPKELMQIVKDNFDLRPGKIVKYVTKTIESMNKLKLTLQNLGKGFNS